MGSYTSKPWGHEYLWASTDAYVGKRLKINANCRLSRQFHVNKTETFTVTSGVMLLEVGTPGTVDFRYVVMHPNDEFHCPAGTVHRMCALQDVELIEISTPQLDDVVRLEDDYGRLPTLIGKTRSTPATDACRSPRTSRRCGY